MLAPITIRRGEVGRMSADDWVKVLGAAGIFLTTAGGVVAATFKWVLQPYKEALAKAEAALLKSEEKTTVMLTQITNKQSVIDELVESHIECELSDGEKYNWIVAITPVLKAHGVDMATVPDLPPRRPRNTINRSKYLQNTSAQNTANTLAATAQPATEDK